MHSEPRGPIGWRWCPFLLPWVSQTLYSLYTVRPQIQNQYSMPVYCPPFTGTHCAYTCRDGQAELTWMPGYILRWLTCPQSPIPVLTEPITEQPCPLSPLDNIRDMVIVWRLRGNIIRTALCWIVWHNVHSQQHTYMSSSYRSNRLPRVVLL